MRLKSVTLFVLWHAIAFSQYKKKVLKLQKKRKKKKIESHRYRQHAAEFSLSVPAYLQLFPSDGVQLCFLSNGKGIDKDLRASSDSHFKVVTILLNLRDALNVFAFLDQVIRET